MFGTSLPAICLRLFCEPKPVSLCSQGKREFAQSVYLRVQQGIAAQRFEKGLLTCLLPAALAPRSPCSNLQRPVLRLLVTSNLQRNFPNMFRNSNTRSSGELHFFGSVSSGFRQGIGKFHSVLLEELRLHESQPAIAQTALMRVRSWRRESG